MKGIRTSLLITVGVSLQENIWSNIIRDSDLTTKPKDKDDILLDLNSHYKKYFNGFIENLNNNCTLLGNVVFPSAEIESLAYWLQEQGKSNLVKISLLHTKTKAGEICAHFIKKEIENLLGNKYGKERLALDKTQKTALSLIEFDFRIEKKELFATDITNFFDIVEKEIALLKSCNIEKIVINITAGYKILISLFSLLGFLKEDVEVIYKHENAREILHAPRLPLSWNFKIFDEYRSLIRRNRSISYAPPSNLAGLFKKDEDVWVMNAYGATISSLYDKEYLKRYGLGERLMKYLSPELGEKLRNNIKRWDHLWIGDQIPETVEHSRAHSTRLLEYVADLLENIFSVKPNFLTGNELMILLYCFWLHDIGHTGLFFEIGGKKLPVGMFPTLVRKWHSFITCQLLKDGDYLPKDEREAVAIICKYHRGKLPLLCKRKPWSDKVFADLKVEPLQKILKQSKTKLLFNNTELEPGRVLLLTALLRICDALDIQSDRVVDEHYWEMRKRRTREEVSYYWELYEKRKPLMALCEPAFNDELLLLEKNIIDCRDKWQELDNWETAQRVEQIIEETIEDPLMRLVCQTFFLPQHVAGSSSDKVESELLPLAAEQLSLLDRVAFKMRQESHFYKHSNVKLVYLTWDSKGFAINMLFAPELGNEKKKQLAAEIWSELINGDFDDVHRILKNNEISFIGIFSEGAKLI